MPATRLTLGHAAVVAVCMLVLFLGYSSQWLFSSAAEGLAPGALSRREAVAFNALLACVWWAYARACTASPGRYGPAAAGPVARYRWCGRCAAPKPPRAHHCRVCGRCIPKMDHHCPWTRNCVSLTTFPHFLRFLAYASLALVVLDAHLARRVAALWAARHLPAYLGPSPAALVHLAVLCLVAAPTTAALLVILASTARAWALNRTTIEDREVERHAAVLRRQRRLRRRVRHRCPAAEDSDDASAAEDVDLDGLPLVEPVQFPFDIGFFHNMAQAMGSSNPLVWLFPLAGSPAVDPHGTGTGWTWEENGLNERAGMWPPPDPDTMRRTAWPAARDHAAANSNLPTPPPSATAEEHKAAFYARQAVETRRRHTLAQRAQRAQHAEIMAELEEDENGLGRLDGGVDPPGYDGLSLDTHDALAQDTPTVTPKALGASRHRRPWASSDGDRLCDSGVDEDEDEDEENVPLAELLRRRRAPLLSTS